MPTPTLTVIAAVARNGVIGRDNALPWHLPADLKRFKALTTGHAVIMGRKTWESLPEKFRPLPGRQNIVVTRNAGYAASGATVVNSLADAVAAASGSEAFVIGGAELYQAALGLADRLELTEIARDYDGDTVFPTRDPAQWRETARESQRDDNGLDFAFVSYARS
ncbi:MAG: dihydrofolate reductase [Sulfuritalea sp.]|jgi:dihydrofolate reductase|nr:dihydrofolate reductase [Sulfuritalea sp.]MCC7311227.1 dihydrofolate reductase [Sulfuritalea sp.]